MKKVRRSRQYKVVLIPSEEGYAVGCPALRGCWSQGRTKREALANIRVAVKEYLAAQKDLEEKFEYRRIKVAI